MLFCNATETAEIYGEEIVGSVIGEKETGRGPRILAVPTRPAGTKAKANPPMTLRNREPMPRLTTRRFRARKGLRKNRLQKKRRPPHLGKLSLHR